MNVEWHEHDPDDPSVHWDSFGTATFHSHGDVPPHQHYHDSDRIVFHFAATRDGRSHR